MKFSSCHGFFTDDNYRYHSPCSTKHITVTVNLLLQPGNLQTNPHTYRPLFLHAVSVVNADDWQTTDLSLRERKFLDSLHVLKFVDLADKAIEDTNFLSIYSEIIIIITEHERKFHISKQNVNNIIPVLLGTAIPITDCPTSFKNGWLYCTTFTTIYKAPLLGLRSRCSFELLFK